MKKANKWHINCGGIVVYQEVIGKTYDQAGKCLACDEECISEENIIFLLENGKYERYDKICKKWFQYDKCELEETLQDIKILIKK